MARFRMRSLSAMARILAHHVDGDEAGRPLRTRRIGSCGPAPVTSLAACDGKIVVGFSEGTVQVRSLESGEFP